MFYKMKFFSAELCTIFNFKFMYVIDVIILDVLNGFAAT